LEFVNLWLQKKQKMACSFVNTSFVFKSFFSFVLIQKKQKIKPPYFYTKNHRTNLKHRKQWRSEMAALRELSPQDERLGVWNGTSKWFSSFLFSGLIFCFFCIKTKEKINDNNASWIFSVSFEIKDSRTPINY
jgi:hypothetical protein